MPYLFGTRCLTAAESDCGPAFNTRWKLSSCSVLFDVLEILDLVFELLHLSVVLFRVAGGA